MFKRFPNKPALAQAAAQTFVDIANDAIRTRGRFVVAISGGSTPRDTFVYLADPEMVKRLDWSKVIVCWVDERCVPPDDTESNYRMAMETLLSHVPIPNEQIHRMRGELPPEEAADKYAATLRTIFQNESIPHFDLILLGMGADGHTASLFPNTKALHETQRWVVANYVEKLATWRLTLTYPVLIAAEHIIVLVTGQEKAIRLQSVLEGPYNPEEQPIQAVQTNGKIQWMADEDAAARLQQS